MKTKLNALDLVVAVDTINGTLSMYDSGIYFKYSKAKREEVMKKLYTILQEQEINNEVENES